MAIHTKILGGPGQDNALFVDIDTGQKHYYLVLDCGSVPFHFLGKALLQQVDALLISHCHMDHICGFDSLFRHLYSRKEPFTIVGPENFTKIMSHRLQGFTWNLVNHKQSFIEVYENKPEEKTISRFYCKEGFSKIHTLSKSENINPTIYENKDFLVQGTILDHRTPSMAYVIQEKVKTNINAEKMTNLGLKPGRWCSSLKDKSLSDEMTIEVEGKSYLLGKLRKELLSFKEPHKVAYVTDLIDHEKNRRNILSIAKGASHLYIESSYLEKDLELAQKNYHLTVKQACQIAKECEVQRLTLFHLSDRYNEEERKTLLQEGRLIFPQAQFPNHWMKSSTSS